LLGVVFRRSALLNSSLTGRRCLVDTPVTVWQCAPSSSAAIDMDLSLALPKSRRKSAVLRDERIEPDADPVSEGNAGSA